MAAAFLQVVLDNLFSLIKEEIGLILGVDDEMHKLASILSTVQAVLQDAEQKQRHSKAVQDWLIKLSDLTYEIDDILDDCATHVSQSERTNSGYSLKRILFRYKIGTRMRQITAKLDAVAAEKLKFHLREMEFDKSNTVVAPTRETSSFLDDTDPVCGREDEREEIIGILMNHSQQLSVLPIIGLGGLGKTTLAQLVFNDPRIVAHFTTRLWVCVSDNFDLKSLVKAVIESGKGSASHLEHLDSLEFYLRDLLNKKRYLLVLDDVWNEDQEKWFRLKNVLACGSTGSSIIVTTRLGKVAEIMGTLPTINIKELSEEHCWMLLKQRAFLKDEEGQYSSLEAIGKQIVKKCSGVPLAAKALGGTLRFMHTEKEWIHVKESEVWNLPEEEIGILPALRLSYYNLPLNMRHCFAYCAIFPKDYEIEKEDLIYLWMAHGYITSNGTLEAEDVGNRIWNELVVRSLFQNVNRGEMGTTTFRLHDLVHDLAQSIMESKAIRPCFTSTLNCKIREVNLSKHYMAFPKSFQLPTDMFAILKNHTRLRVFDASWIGRQDLPATIGNLKHLRYLNLSGSDISTLPDSLCGLWNLQTLILDFCTKLVGFPKNMRYLKNLRHLLMKWCFSLRETPSKLSELGSLRKLDLFIVGDDRGKYLEELQTLNLEGKLEIQNLQRVQNELDAKKSNLSEKQNLLDLRLVWEFNSGTSTSKQATDAKVLQALQPHPNLVCLQITGYCGRYLPTWVTNSTLEKLVTVKIKNCENLLSLCQVEMLPKLKQLVLGNVAVEYIGEGGDLNVFPSLEIIHLFSLPNLKGLLKEEVGDIFPNLRRLYVQHCPLLVLPPTSSFKKLEDWSA